MTKTDFIGTLDFEVAKNSIARKLGIKADDLEIKSLRSGDFKIDLSNVSGKVSSLFSGGRAIIITERLNIKENKDNFSYDANVILSLKNRSGEYRSKIGKINLTKDKFVFSTMNDIKKAKKMSNNTKNENTNDANTNIDIESKVKAV